jgi:hypothetical protein
MRRTPATNLFVSDCNTLNVVRSIPPDNVNVLDLFSSD